MNLCPFSLCIRILKMPKIQHENILKRPLYHLVWKWKQTSVWLSSSYDGENDDMWLVYRLSGEEQWAHVEMDNTELNDPVLTDTDDPKIVYMENIFYPGRFSIETLLKALSVSNSLSASHDNWCTAALLNRIITAQWEGMGDVGSARYEPALLPSCPTIRVLCYSDCQRSTHSHQQFKG